jgi:hypothetical protein
VALILLALALGAGGGERLAVQDGGHAHFLCLLLLGLAAGGVGTDWRATGAHAEPLRAP